jgi:mono/diheme cytochrome c family protein
MKNALREIKKIALLLVIFSLGCSKSNTNIELIQDMMESPAVKAQDFNPKRPGEAANMLPPEGTQAIGHIPYKFKGKADEAERALTNPMAGQNLARGKELFETYCYVCHGLTGDGKGPVAPKFQVPMPALTTDKVRGFKDGRIFHIITDGQGVMGSYATQIKREKDRWAVVNYVRSLKRE